MKPFKYILTSLAIAFSLSSMAQVPKCNMKYANYHIFIPAHLNGKPANVAFDTGASGFYIDSTYLAGSGLKFNKIGNAMIGGVGGKKLTKLIFGDVAFDIGDLHFTPSVTPIIQLKPIISDNADALMGIEDIAGKIIFIDFSHRQIGFSTQLSSSDIEGYVPIDIQLISNRIYIPITVTVDNKTTISGNILMDTGSGASLSLSSAAANKYNMKNNGEELTFIFGGVGGKSSSFFVNASRLSIGPFALNNLISECSTDTQGALAVNDNSIGLAGNKIWERFDIIIDLKIKKLYLKPNDSFSEEYSYTPPEIGFFFTDRTQTLGCWVVNGLFKGKRADKAGLMNGDEILSVDGRDVKTFSKSEQIVFSSSKQPVILNIRRGSTSMTISIGN
jgi:hypothetical protein